MPDSYTCKLCKTTLTCSCNSMECGFDYDIADHTRRDLIEALDRLLAWHPEWSLNALITYLTRTATEAMDKRDS
jgi:hypothetical protein